MVKAQKRLNALRCAAGPVDGEVGPWTRSAVVRFQSRSAMRQSGHLDGARAKRLYDEDAPRCDVRPVPPARAPAGGSSSPSTRTGSGWSARRAGSSKGGMVDNPSVLHHGSYATGSYCGRAARIKRNSATSGGLWLDDFVRFAPCGIGFHRIPRHKSNGHQIHADWILRDRHGVLARLHPAQQAAGRAGLALHDPTDAGPGGLTGSGPFTHRCGDCPPRPPAP